MKKKALFILRKFFFLSFFLFFSFFIKLYCFFSYFFLVNSDLSVLGDRIAKKQKKPIKYMRIQICLDSQLLPMRILVLYLLRILRIQRFLDSLNSLYLQIANPMRIQMAEISWLWIQVNQTNPGFAANPKSVRIHGFADHCITHKSPP